MPLFKSLGKFHALEIGAKRYVDGVTGDDGFNKHFKNGTFLASKKGVSGPMIDQASYKHGAAYGDTKVQLAAYNAVVSHA